MWEIVLRCITTGKIHRVPNSYTPSLDKREVVFWQGPDDNQKSPYRVISWKWMGHAAELVKMPSKYNEYTRIADDFLLSLDFPEDWKDEIRKLSENGKFKSRSDDSAS